MHSYLQPQDDGLPMRPSGAWVAEKLDYLLEHLIALFLCFPERAHFHT